MICGDKRWPTPRWAAVIRQSHQPTTSSVIVKYCRYRVPQTSLSSRWTRPSLLATGVICSRQTSVLLASMMQNMIPSLCDHPRRMNLRNLTGGGGFVIGTDKKLVHSMRLLWTRRSMMARVKRWNEPRARRRLMFVDCLRVTFGSVTMASTGTLLLIALARWTCRYWTVFRFGSRSKFDQLLRFSVNYNSARNELREHSSTTTPCCS